MKEIEDFLEELILRRNLSASTVIAYEKDLNDYIVYIQQKNIVGYNISEEDFREYFDNLKKELKKTSLRRKYSTIISFYKYLWKNKLVDRIYEYNINEESEEVLEKVANRHINSGFDKIFYESFINSLEENLNDTRIKVISILVAELNISLVNIFEIQIKDLLKYDFKKIVINRNNKVFDYDLDERVTKILKDYYNNYVQEKRFLFSKYNIQAFRKDLKRFNLSIADLKKALAEDEESIYENIKRIYFKIGIGDE